MAEYIEREKALDLFERYDKDTAVREIKRLPKQNSYPIKRKKAVIE